MSKVGAVIRREFVERVRSRWFWISAILLPVLFAMIFLLPMMFMGSGGARRIAVVDGTTTDLGTRVTAALAAGGTFAATRVARHSGVIDSLTRQTATKAIDGLLIVDDSLVVTGSAEYRGTNVSSLRDMQELERTLGVLVIATRLEQAGVDSRVLARAELPLRLTTRKISAAQTTGESSTESFSLAYLMGTILYTTILMYGVNVKSSVLEEKTTRIVEVLVSSVRPFTLLFGKVIGVGAVSLLQLLIWAVAGKLLLSERATLAAQLGADQGPALFEIPHVSAATGAVFAAYFLGGFFLYSAMFAAAGAMSSSEQEAQQAQQPIVLVLLVSFVSLFVLIGDPSSTFAIVLSLVPFTSPIAMPVRWAAGDLPLTDLAVSLGLLVIGVVGTTWIAARIYRVGILMTGKRPNIKELVRWVRAS